MAKSAFPGILHVTRESPPNDDPFFIVHEDGVQSLDEPQPVAIYKLHKLGRVEINKRFEADDVDRMLD